MKKLIITYTICLFVSSSAIALTQWSDPVLLSELNDPTLGKNALFPSLSSDQLTMYFTRTASDGKPHMYEAYRDTTSGSFHTIREISELYDGSPVYTGWVSGDGLRFYYTESESHVTKMILRMASRNSIGDQWTDTMTFSDIHTNYVYDAYCSLSPDELTIYYARGEFPAYSRIYKATRSSINEQFSNPVHLSDLNINTLNVTPFIMPDGETMYFTSGHNASDYDLYVATDFLSGIPNIEKLNISSTSDWEVSPYVTPDGMTLYYHTSEGIMVSHVVPEPTTLYLLGFGGLAMLRRRK